ncbi:hypothetical protein FOL47_006872 [Perkinsus chesapeaki]|uniref:Uncharacterized protein n=1 Tax=Perkinsus chesapeaki TaxID=330153 RepID=A0A7J6LNY3_PERCH|nr:hypothetical protein FOL47_006872 [Perkinsus chesapeaki]
MPLVLASSHDTPQNSTGKPAVTANGASGQPPSTTAVSFPSHVQLSGATGCYANDINGSYVLQSSSTIDNMDKKWQFRYTKTTSDAGKSVGGKKIMCYGEGVPELGTSPKGADDCSSSGGLAGWVVGWLDGDSSEGSFFVVARCVKPVNKSDCEFRWEIKDDNGKFNSIETMDARLVMASSSSTTTTAVAVSAGSSPTAVDATALIKKQLHIGSPTKKPVDKSTKEQQKISLTNLLANAQAQMEAATASGNVATSDSSEKSSKHSSRNGKPRHPTTPLSADAPAFVPCQSSLSASAPPFVPHQSQQKMSAQSPIQSKAFGTNSSSIEQLFRNAHLQQGVRVNAQLRKVSWNLGAVRDQLKTIAPGEGLVSATFRLPLDDFTPGPPMKFKFFPFGISGKSAPGCVAVELDCPQGARMKFRISIGGVCSGTKVLMGNAYYVDFDAAKLSTDKGEAPHDSGVVQAIKFDELVVALELIDWLQ